LLHIPDPFNSMHPLVEDLAPILKQVNRPGDYYAAGIQDIHAPRLEVAGVGTIALPLLPALKPPT